MNAERSRVALDMAEALARSGECALFCEAGSDAMEWRALVPGRITRALEGCRSLAALGELFEGSDVARRAAWLARRRALTPFSGVHRIAGIGDQGEVWVEERLVRTGSDGSGGMYGFLIDVTEREQHRERLVYLACFDELTGHFTRARLRTDLSQRIVDSFRDSKRFCFAFIGLDHMVGINHAFGYDVADDILRGVGRRIFDALGENESIGRVASSKFGLILDGDDVRDVERRLRAIQDDLRDKVLSTNSGPVAVTVSIGAVLLPDDAETTQDAFAAAEDALTAAKTNGPGSFTFHTPNAEEIQMRRKNLAAAEMLSTALKEDRVKLAFQPIVHARKPDDCAFFECLARIFGPDGNPIPAAEFMPVAEQLGIVRMIDQRVLVLAFEALRAQPLLRLSVNLSPQSLFDDCWHRNFEQVADAHPDLCERLIVEITESAAIHDSAAAADRIARIAARGCRIALDDFGAGYTSFSNFKTLRFDLVKIDGSYVRGIIGSRDNRAFVETLARLSKHFNMGVVAEMVEDDASAQLLVELGVDYLQGFHFGRPAIPESSSGPENACVGL